MELSSLQCYGLIIYTLIFTCATKPFSLNEAIAAESRANQILETSNPNLSEISPERLSLNKPLRHEKKILKPKKFKVAGLADTILALRENSPLLKYIKPLQLRSPLKAKHLKSKFNLVRRNQAVKRHAHDNNEIEHEYAPLLKNLGLLVDHLLTDESGNSYESEPKPRNKFKRNRHYTEERDGIVCSCALKSDLDVKESKQREKTVAVAPTKVTLTTEASTTTTDYTTSDDIGSVRRNKDDSLLFTGNTNSRRRNNFGHNERSNASFHRSDQGHNTWNYGDSKHNTRDEGGETSSEDNEEYSKSDTRHSASDGIGGIRGSTYYPRYTNNGDEIKKPKDEFENEISNKHVRREVKQPEGQNKLEVDGGEREIATVLPEHVRGPGTFVPESTVGFHANASPSQETDEGSRNDFSSHKRVTVGDGEISAKNKKLSESDEAVVIDNPPDQHRYLSHTNKSKPIVMIIDGYSVARDKNGKNKYAENKIRIQP